CYVQGDSGVPFPWRIHFKLPRQPAGDATLVLAFAGADRAKIAIDVNGSPAQRAPIAPPDQGGNGLIREAIHTKYSYTTVPIPAANLHAGDNTITLTQTATSEYAYIMYDYVCLELP